jgi:hypothetical protein
LVNDVFAFAASNLRAFSPSLCDDNCVMSIEQELSFFLHLYCEWVYNAHSIWIECMDVYGAEGIQQKSPIFSIIYIKALTNRGST